MTDGDTCNILQRKLARWPESKKRDLAGTNHISLGVVISVSISGKKHSVQLLLFLNNVQRPIPPSSGTKLEHANYSSRLHAGVSPDLMRWGFMNSVLTDPRISLLLYSTRLSSPALKIMHTWAKDNKHEMFDRQSQFTEHVKTWLSGVTHIFIFKEELLVATRAWPRYLA